MPAPATTRCIWLRPLDKARHRFVRNIVFLFSNRNTTAFICRRRRGAFGCATWTSCVLTVCFLLAFGEMCRSTATQRRAFGCNPLDGDASGVVLAKALFRNSGVHFDLGMQRELLDILKSRFSSGSADDSNIPPATPMARCSSALSAFPDHEHILSELAAAHERDLKEGGSPTTCLA